MHCQNKVAIITGASSGIGKATVYKFAQEGINTVLFSRDLSALLTIVEDLKQQSSVKCLAVSADITQPTDIDRVIDQTISEFGVIDIIVNAAGIIASGTIQSTSLADWDYMMNVNVRGPFYLIQCALPYLIKQKGVIVNVSSVTGLRAFPGILAYCTSKAALDQLTRCLALELAKDGVRVNAVNPGVVVTQLHRRSGMDEEKYAAFLEHSKSTHPLGRVGRPDEIAELIYFLASPQSGWITGETIAIDGGRHQTCAR